MQKTCIVIVGPTAVGKTAVALHIAKHYCTEIISADSRQCYRELNIGVAKPSPAELSAVPHHFINSHSIQDEVTAAVFEQYALAVVHQLFVQHDVVVMAGGTGLYVKAFCEGLDAVPAVSQGIRQEIIHNYQKEGMPWLVRQLQEKDPHFARHGEMQNPQRMMRALEVIQATGQSILQFHAKASRPRDFNIIKIGLQLPREILYRRVNERVDHMMSQGLLQEVASLRAFAHLNALQTVGYSELFDYMEAQCTLDDAVRLIKQHTRNYAKRQLTWFRKDNAITWFAPDDIQAILEWINQKLKEMN